MKTARSLSLVLFVAVTSCSDEPIEKDADTSMEITDTYKKGACVTRDANHPDAKIIKQLIEAGADLSKPHKPDFQFDFKGADDARALAEKLQQEGFSSKIYAPQEGYPTYELVAEKEMFIEFMAMADLTDRLRELAEENNGKMSGWGTSVEE